MKLNVGSAFAGQSSLTTAFAVHGAAFVVSAVGSFLLFQIMKPGALLGPPGGGGGDGLWGFFPTVLSAGLFLVLFVPTFYAVWACAPNAATASVARLTRVYAALPVFVACYFVFIVIRGSYF